MGFLKTICDGAKQVVKAVGKGFVAAAGIYAAYRGYTFLQENCPKVEAKGKELGAKGLEAIKGLIKKNNANETSPAAEGSE